MQPILFCKMRNLNQQLNISVISGTSIELDLLPLYKVFCNVQRIDLIISYQSIDLLHPV